MVLLLLHLLFDLPLHPVGLGPGIQVVTAGLVAAKLVQMVTRSAVLTIAENARVDQKDEKQVALLLDVIASHTPAQREVPATVASVTSVIGTVDVTGTVTESATKTGTVTEIGSVIVTENGIENGTGTEIATDATAKSAIVMFVKNVTVLQVEINPLLLQLLSLTTATFHLAQMFRGTETPLKTETSR